MTWRRLLRSTSAPSGLGAIALAACLLAASSAPAEAPYLEFIHALQERGYGDMAVAQLERWSAQQDLPNEIREVLDWELSKSHRLCASQTKDPAQIQKHQAASQQAFERFEKDHPNHPATAESLLFDGDAAFEKGSRLLGQAQGTEDQAAATKLKTDARAEFVAAHKNFELAVERFRKWLDESPARDADRSRRTAADVQYEQTEQGWIEAKLKVAASDYFDAQTYAADAPERKAKFEQAGKAFDAIYQLYREFQTGLKAHLWHGKVAEEQGNLVLAQDIYDEVLGSEPEDLEGRDDRAYVYGQAALWNVQLNTAKATADKIAEYLEKWIDVHRDWRFTAPYQGMALESAKIKISLAEKETPIKKDRMIKEALASLAGVAKLDSEYQREAIELRKKYSGPTSAVAGSFDEQIEIAAASIETEQWQDAVTGYAAAMARKDVPNDPTRLAEVKRRYNYARMRQAQTLFEAKNFDECIALASRVVGEDPTDRSAPASASLAIFSAVALYDAAPEAEKPAALDRLKKIANVIGKTWPQGPAFDDAQVALGQVHLRRGEMAEGLACMEQVPSTSPRFSTAAATKGRIYWRSYLTEKKKPADQRDAALMEQSRTKAYEAIKGAHTAQGSAQPSDDTLESWAETNLMLAEICVESQNTDEANQLLDPLVATIVAAKRESLADWEASVLMLAMRARDTAGQVARAAEAATALLGAAPDTPKINGVAIDFCRVLHGEWKKADAPAVDAPAEAAPAEAAPADSAAVPPAAAAPAAAPGATKAEIETALRGLLPLLAKRQQHTPIGMAQLAEICGDLRMPDQARELCQRVIDKADADAEFAKTGAKVVTRVRAQLISLLRAEGKVDEASKQVEALLKTHPKALDLHMLKGEILQSQAEKDPKRYDESIAHWTRLRLMLSQTRPRPNEYFEVVYNAALCLMKQSRAIKDAEKAKQAEQLLKATLTLDPEVGGAPDLKSKYDALLKIANAVQPKAKPATSKKADK